MQAQVEDAPGGRDREPLPPTRTTTLLAELVETVEGDKTSLGWLLAQLKLRAFGYALLVFSLPSCLPMPPGIPTVCGLVLALVGVQMIIGTRRLWLPSVLARREIGKERLRAMVARATPWIGRLERLARPRLAVFTGAIGHRLVGSVVVILAIVMALPIPFFGNMPPAIAILIIAIGLTEGDGLIVAVGLAVSVVALALSGTVAVEGVHWFIGAVGA